MITLFLIRIERDTNPLFLAPYHPALPDGLAGFDDQLKFVRNAEGGWNVKGGASIRQIADGATEGTAVEFDHRALEYTTSISPAIFYHCVALFWPVIEQVC